MTSPDTIIIVNYHAATGGKTTVPPCLRPCGGNVANAEFVIWVTFSNPTQPKMSGPNPTQPIIDTWYGILGYTENFIQQLTRKSEQFDYK